MEAARTPPLGEAVIPFPVTAPTLSDKQRCSGCGRCVAACAARLYTLEPFGYRKLSINNDPEKCTGCSRCIEACPLGLLADGTITC